VASRRADTVGKTLRFTDGRLSGRPPKHGASNLLAGLATCASCGGGLVVETSGHKRGRVREYVCHRHRANGTCTNDLRLPVDDLNDAVLREIEAHALTPEAVESVIALSERDDVQERQAALRQERADLAQRLARLVSAIETGGDVPALTSRVRDLETRSRAIDLELAHVRPVPRLPQRMIENRLADS